jgi:DNA primase
MKFAMCGLAAVSFFGWHPSNEQIQLLKGLAKGVVFLPDRNKTTESHQVLPALAEQFWLRFPPLPAGCEDPESLTLEQIYALTK